MNKILLAAGVLMLFAATSCKKDWDCNCTTTDSSGTFPAVSTTIQINDASKKDAEDACAANETTVGTLSTSCSASKR